MAREVRDPTLTVRFDILERDYENVKRYSLDAGFLTSTDGFDVDLFEEDRSLLRNLELQPVELLINGHSQLIGRIDQTDRGGDGTVVSCRGRDYIADLVECHVDPSLRLAKDMALTAAIKLAAGPVGIAKVLNASEQVMRNVRTGRAITVSDHGPDLKPVKVEDYKPKPSEGIYEFLNRIVARHGITMQPGKAREEIVLAQPNYAQESAYKIERRIGAPSGANNVLSATASRDLSSFATFVLVTGKESPPGLTTKTIHSIIPIQGGFGFLPIRLEESTVSFPTPPNTPENALPIGLPDTGALLHKGRIRPEQGPKTTPGLYRLHYLRDEDSRKQDQLDRAALRVMAEHLKETLRYEVTLRGHDDPETGRVFAVDTLIDVNDEVCDLSETLWIERRTFEYDETGGARTKLVCWRPGAFLI